MTETTGTTWVICWEPGNDFGDHDLSELVKSVARTHEAAFAQVKRLAEQKADQVAMWSDERGRIEGEDQVRSQLAAGRSETRLRVMEANQLYGSIVAMQVPHA
jgi:hypothetical protein